MLAAHRGVKSLAPENTFAGIQKAADLGIAWVEIDTQLSACLTPMAIHDETVNRCSNGRGKVRQLTAQQIGELDGGSWFNKSFAGEKIPTLSQVLSLVKSSELSLNLELKVYNDDEVELLVDRVIEVIKTHGFPVDKLLFSSFSLSALLRCKEKMSAARRGFISQRLSADTLELVQEAGLYSVHLNHKKLKPEHVQAVKAAGLVTQIWTLNKPAKATKFFDWGVDVIITDKPQEF